MMNGSYQVLEGLGVERVTAEILEISIKAAVDEVKASKPNDTEAKLLYLCFCMVVPTFVLNM